MIPYPELKAAAERCVAIGLAHCPVVQDAASRAAECARLRSEAKGIVGACASAGWLKFPKQSLSADEAWKLRRQEQMRGYSSRNEMRKDRANKGPKRCRK